MYLYPANNSEPQLTSGAKNLLISIALVLFLYFVGIL